LAKRTTAPSTSPRAARSAAPKAAARTSSPAARPFRSSLPPSRDVVDETPKPKEKRVAMPRQPGFKVRATAMGYHNDERKRIGDVFTLNYAHEFTSKWMERVASATPHRATTGQQELRRKHDEMLQERSSGLVVGPDNPEGGPDPYNASDSDE
jgi:hypothetical protein